MNGNYLSLVLLLVVIILIDAKEWCVDHRQNLSNCHEVHLSCKKGFVISEVDMYAGNNDCDHTSTCRGLPPETQADVMSCYWKQNCSIKIPSQSIVFFTNTLTFTPYKQKGNCFVMPKSFHVKKLSCTSATDVRDICYQNGMSTLRIQHKGQSSGIIRSHSQTPWDYPENQKNCSLTFSYPVLDTVSYYTLLTIVWLDINFQNNNLVVRYSKNKRKRRKNVKKTRNISIRGIKSSSVFIDFTTNWRKRGATGKGFVICYRHKVISKRSKKKRKNSVKKIQSHQNRHSKKRRTKNKGKKFRIKRRAKRRKKDACRSVMEDMVLEGETISLHGNSSFCECGTVEEEFWNMN
ncbi:uncharacterized protein LOC133192207 [Saccostrea echinata]|uniref:uncharacterized protein LOC133192207 n=1 Tax=Saccostrea echinata TaxID=191078 RepID=UPI002A7FB417|nr:uncharacterized protein LOC133192207 [Saccostrea echinata]